MTWHRSPFGPFLVLAGASFAAHSILSPPERDTIAVTTEMIEAIADNHEVILARSLTDEERVQAVDDFIETEMLVREAVRQGLDRGDRRIRQYLADAGRSALVGAAQLDDPAPAEIEEFFEGHRALFDTPASVSLEYVSFVWGALANPEEQHAVLAALRDGEPPAAVAGGRGNAGEFRTLTRTSLSQSNGRAFASRVFDLAPGDWHGPIESKRGHEFIRVTGHTPARSRRLEEVEHLVRQELVARAHADLARQALEPIRHRYHITIDGPEAGTP